MASSIAEGMGGSCEVNILHGYPVLSNHEAFTRRAAGFSRQLLGDENVVDLELRMTSEDFAYFAEQIPGCVLPVWNHRCMKENIHHPCIPPLLWPMKQP